MKSHHLMGILLLIMAQIIKKRLGEILIEDGVLTKENLEEALHQQKKEGGLIGQILIRLGYISEENLVAAIGKQLQIPYLPLSNYSINIEATQAFGEDFCRKNMMLAFDRDDKRIYLALADPLNDTAIGEVQKKTNLKAQVFISTGSEIFSMLDLAFRTSLIKPEIKKAG